jgi:hypothetical protein
MKVHDHVHKNPPLDTSLIQLIIYPEFITFEVVLYKRNKFALKFLLDFVGKGFSWNDESKIQMSSLSSQ